MTDLEHLDAEIARCQKFVDMLTGGNVPTTARDRFLERRDALQRIRDRLEPPHSDDAAVDRFAEAMKQKLAKKRVEGFGGWDGTACNVRGLSAGLRRHVDKGDPVDVSNFAMMIHQRGGVIE